MRLLGDLFAKASAGLTFTTSQFGYETRTVLHSSCLVRSLIVCGGWRS
jgi:hypothetical protein